MSYLKLAFASFSKNKLTFFLIIIEIAALFLTVNFLVSTLMDRQMLTKVYEKLLNDNSAVVWDNKHTENIINGLAATPEESRKIALSEITDGYEIYEIFSLFNTGVDILVIVPDEIYDNLALPLVSGDYSGAVANFGYTKDTFSYFYTVPGEEKEETRLLEIEVSGTLTADTFLPMINAFATGNDFTTKDLYINSREYNSFLITRKSVFDGIDIPTGCSPVFIIHFPENYEENIAKLSEKAAVQEGKAILENSRNALWTDLTDFLPVVLCVLLVVIIGTVSISVIMNKKNEKRSGVLWICGYSRKQILFSHFINMLMIFIISIILSVIAYLILSFMKIELVVSANLSIANIIATVILSLVLIAASMIIPAVKSKNTSPVEYLRRAK